jgi:hypothetical protein
MQLCILPAAYNLLPVFVAAEAGGRCEVWTRDGGIQASQSCDSIWMVSYI